MSPPDVFPHDPCSLCLKGDTSTALLIDGDQEFYVWVLTRILRIERDEALHLASRTPEGLRAVILCQGCATKLGVVVHPSKVIGTTKFELDGLSQALCEANGLYVPDDQSTEGSSHATDDLD
jgi:hypothetical protein